jgi:hypothetical protein
MSPLSRLEFRQPSGSPRVVEATYFGNAFRGSAQVIEEASVPATVPEATGHVLVGIAGSIASSLAVRSRRRGLDETAGQCPEG